MTEHLRFERDGSVEWIYLNNPSKHNALDRGMLRGLIAHLESLWNNQEVSAIVITGSGERSFATGMNINEFVGLDAVGAHGLISELGRVCELIRTIPLPVVAAINGFCIGGAMEMTLAADIRVASDNATFGMPEVKLGLPSVIDAALLQQYVGLGLAKEMLMVGDTVPVARINAVSSMISRTVPLEQLREVATEFATKLSSNPRETNAIQKDLFETWQNCSLEIALRDSKNALAMAFATEVPGQRIAEIMRK